MADSDKKKQREQIIEEEENILKLLYARISQEKDNKAYNRYDRDFKELREALDEERTEDDRAMLLDQMGRTAALMSREANYKRIEIDTKSPYFGHLKYHDEEEEEPKEVLIGKGTFIDKKIRLVDWRNAPVSRIFYSWQEDDYFDENIAGREISGKVLARRSVTIGDRNLLKISAPQGNFIKKSDGWKDAAEFMPVLHKGDGQADRPDRTRSILGGYNQNDLRGDKHLQEIASLLDLEQFKLITKPDSGLVAVKGGAGSGKTTVALHRIAYLNYNAPERYRPKRMMIMVFNVALAEYISRVLPALGVQNVPVWTLAKWSKILRRRHFRKLTPHYTDAAPSTVVRLKTHRIMIPMLEDAAKQNRKSDPAKLFDELFTDRKWIMDGVNKYAPGAFSKYEIDQIVRWNADQHFWRVEKGGPNVDDIPAYDPEDDIILLRLYQLLRGPLLKSHNRSLVYDHLMVDEAQDFSPLELKVLIECVSGRSVTFAGDIAQKITEYNDFSQWNEVLEILNHGHVEVNSLMISYRSTRQVMEFAHHVLGHLAPKEEVKAVREGENVALFSFHGMGEAIAFLADALNDLMDREPNAGVAVLTRHVHQADSVYKALKRTDVRSLSRVRAQDFRFGPGIEVTDISQTKGLEFDYVIIMNADAQTFAENDNSRHLLHVGATRAIHQVWLMSWKPVSPLIPKEIIDNQF